MKDSLISIIIPTFNRKDLIINCLKSIKSQTYSNWECIIIDDHSTDNSFQIIKKFIEDDGRIKVLKRPDNLKKGANSCRNFGYQVSKGKYILWFDSDDLMKPNKLYKQLALIKKTGSDYVISQTEVLDTITGVKRFWNDNLLSDSPLDDYIQYKVSWAIGSVLLKKKTILDNDLKFNENLAQSQEYDFYINLLKKSTSYSIDNTILNTVIWHSNSISFSLNNFFIKSKSSLMVRKRLLFDNKLNLKKETKVFLIKEIFRIFSKSIENNNMKAIRESCFTLIPSIIIAPIGVVYKIKCIVYATLIFLSYTFTGRGYYFYKKIKI